MFKSSGFSLPFYRKETIYEKLFLNGCTCMGGVDQLMIWGM